MGQRAQLQAYSFQRGINRLSSQLEPPDGYCRDAYNVLPRIPGGVQCVRGDTVLSANLGGEVTDLFSYYDAAGAWRLIARVAGAGYKYSTDGASWSSLSGAPALGSGAHSMATFRGLLVMAEEGQTIAFWSGSGAATTSPSYPKGGLAAELSGRLCVCAEPVGTSYDASGAPAFPGLRLPCYGLKLPMTEASKLWGGTVTIADASSTTSLLTVVTGASIPACTGATLVVGSMAFSITASTATTVTVSKIDQNPAPTTGAVSAQIYDTSAVPFLVAYPNPAAGIDLGQTALAADTGAVSVRLFNRSPITVRLVDVRAKGQDFRIEELPVLPYEIPAHGSAVFKVIGCPTGYGTDSNGTISGSIVVEHDLLTQSTLTLPVTLSCIRSGVLFNPSCLDFGAWLAGQAPSLPVAVNNPLTDTVAIKFASGTATPFSISGAPTAWTEVAARKSLTYTVAYAPAGADAAAFAASRAQMGVPSRLRMSQIQDQTTWDWDYDWLDLNQGDSYYGKPTAIVNYDDALVAFKDSEIGIVQRSGGPLGFTYQQLTLGKGVGAMSAKAITAGEGSLWWVAKSGAYRLSAQSVDPIDLPIFDVIRSVAAADFGKVCAAFYDGYFLMSVPMTGLEVAEGVWWYHVASQGWWRTASHTPAVAGLTSKRCSAMAIRRGAADKPALYAANVVAAGSTTYPVVLRDSDTVASGLPFSLTPGFYAGGNPGINKWVEALSVVADVPGHFSDGSLQVLTTHGDTVLGVVESPAKTILVCGVGTVASGVLSDPNLNLVAGQLAGATMEIAGLTYTISGNTANTITYGGPQAGPWSYRVTAADAAGVVTVPMYLKECYGASFRITLSGAKVASTPGNLYGLTVHLVPMYPFGGERGRVP